jgi:hypothetical protein
VSRTPELQPSFRICDDLDGRALSGLRAVVVARSHTVSNFALIQRPISHGPARHADLGDATSWGPDGIHPIVTTGRASGLSLTVARRVLLGGAHRCPTEFFGDETFKTFQVPTQDLKKTVALGSLG